MNESTRKELMMVIEKAVRPIRAGETRKLKMREELLAHLTAIYEEEHARCGDERAAVEAARQRFGDPRELAKELQESVPFMNCIPYLTEKLNYQPGESLFHFIVRYMVGYAGMLGIMMFLLLPPALLGMTRDPWHLYLTIFAKSYPALLMLMVLWILLVAGMRKALFGEDRSRGQAILYGLLSAAVMPLWAFVLYALCTGDLSGSLAHLGYTCLIAPLAPLLLVSMTRQVDREIRIRAEWAELELGE
jgi:hypothetical protein